MIQTNENREFYHKRKMGENPEFFWEGPRTSCSRTRSLIRPGRAKVPARTK